MAFQCVIVTPEQQVLDESVTQVIVPAHDGQIGILTDRAPLLVKLGLGPLRIDAAGAGAGTRVLFVEGGIAQMKDNRLTILTNEAIPANEIDAETARAEYAEADAQRPTDAKSAEERQRRMQRARVLQDMAKK
jgi:F-type H+-transporting ATPase subunit epsilon